MALADTQKLLVILGLDDKLSPKLGKSQAAVKKFGGNLDKAGQKSSAFGGKLAKAGAVAAGAFVGGLALAVKTGLSDLAELETATTSVDAAIAQMGKTGKVTSGQIADWANEIEANVGAAFDDKAITAATATLLRFGKVTTANIRPAMEVMTDLAAKTGDVDSAASLLAKALADPTKAAGKLARQGIILTKAQEKQIKAFVKAGEKGKAQAVVLDAIAKSTKGAAAASQGPYQRALSTLSDVAEDARKALAEGFLPVIQRVADKLSKGLADPKVMQNIRDFGKGLARAFDNAVKFVEGIDWDAVGSGLKSAFSWGQKFVGVFNSLPAETKGLIIGLAGLTKLTGGAPIKIAVDFAKEGIKGILGHFFERGSSPANPMWVQQVGGKGGPDTPGGSGKGGKTPSGSKGRVRTPDLGQNDSLADRLKDVAKKGLVLTAAAVTVRGDTVRGAPGGAMSETALIADLRTMIAQGRGGENVGNGQTASQLLAKLTGVVQSTSENERGEQRKIRMAVDREREKVTSTLNTAKNDITANERGEQGKARAKLDALQAKQQAATNAFREGERATLSGINSSKNAITGRLGTANERLAQIRAKRMSFTTNVTAVAQVSVRNVNNTTKTYTSYGGSRTTNTAL